MKQTLLNIKHGFIGRTIIKSADFLEQYVSSWVLLAIRLWMASIFWYSGLTKIADWQSTIALFQNVYSVPFISPQLAAFLSTITELTCPILLALGFATRLATVPMLIMTAVIQFTYLQSPEHFYWAMLLGTLLCCGPGKIALDYCLKKLS